MRGAYDISIGVCEMKTIIDEIQARHEVDEKLGYSNFPNIHQDRATLLAILAEIGALPERWDKCMEYYEENEAVSCVPVSGSTCANQLKAILIHFH